MASFYFSHDYTARSDDKIKQLIRRHGMAGYGIFWAIVEDLYQNANALRCDCDGIAYDLRVDSDMVKSILFDFDLFVHNDDKFGSESVERRLNERSKRSEKARESASYRWGNANALQTESDRNAIKERKGKESKEKESKEDNTDMSTSAPVRVKRSVFVPPTIEEVREYAETEMIGSKILPEKFHNYYESNGWRVGKNPMKNWKTTFKNWSLNEKDGTYQQPISGQFTGKTKSELEWERFKAAGTDPDKGRRELAELLGFPTD